MQKNRDSIFDIFANPGKYPVAYFFFSFFVITPLLGLAINGFSGIIFESFCTYLSNQFGIDKLICQLIIASVFFLFVLLSIWLFKIPQLFECVLGQPEARTINLQEQFPGLITAASKPSPNRQTPAEVAVRYHLQNKGSLKHCWIICTKESIEGAKNFIDKLVDEGLASRDIFHLGSDYRMDNLSDYENELSLFVDDIYADDPNYIRELIDSIYGHASMHCNLDESQIITDYTGATKSFTAGIILACANPKRRLQYISQFDGEIKEIKISYRLRPIKQA